MAIIAVKATKATASSGTTVTMTSLTATAGNALLVGGGGYENGTTGQTLTVTRSGDIFTTDTQGDTSAATDLQRIGIASAPSVGAGPTNLVATVSGAQGVVAFALEVSGLPSSAILDATSPAINIGSGTSATSNGLTNATAAAIYVTYVGSEGGGTITITPDGAWTDTVNAVLMEETNAGSFPAGGLSYQIVASSSARNGAYTVSNADWGQVIAVYKADAGATVTPPMFVVTASLPTPTVIVPVSGTVVTPAKLTLASTLLMARTSDITYGAAAFTATNAATITPALPLGWQVGDIHLLIAARSDNTAMTDPGDRWALLSAGNNSAAQRVEFWWRLAEAGDAAPAITFGSGTVVRGARIVGVEAGTPVGTGPFVGITRSDKTDVAAATVTFTDLTPSEPDTVLVALYAYEDDPSTASTISGWTTFNVAVSALGTDMALGAASRTYSPATATGALTTTVATGTFANSPSVGFLIAIERTLVPVIITPPMLTATSSLLTPTVVIGAGGQSYTATPPMLAATSSLLTPTLLATRSPVVAPSMLVATSSLLSATGTGSTTATAVPGQLVATASLLTPTLAATRAPIISPALLVATVSQLTPTLLATRAPVISPSMLVVASSLLASVGTGAQNATISPPTLVVATSLLTPTVQATQAPIAAPAMLTVTSSLLTPSVTTGQSAIVTPSMLVAASSFLTPTLLATQAPIITPSMLLAATSVLTPTIQATRSPVVTPSMLITASSLLTPTLLATQAPVVTPAALVVASSVLTPTVLATQAPVISPSLLVVASSLLTPSVSTGGSVTVTPPMLAVASSLLTPTVSVSGSITITPVLLVVASSLLTPTTLATRAPVVSPALLTAVSSLLTPTVQATQAPIVTPVMLTAATSLLTPILIPSQTRVITPSILVAATSLLTPTVSGARSATVTPTMLTLSVSVLDVTVSASSSASVTLTPSMLTLQVTVLTVTVVVSVGAIQGEIMLAATLLHVCHAVEIAHGCAVSEMRPQRAVLGDGIAPTACRIVEMPRADVDLGEGIAA